jgi:catechol 2,3-dioxygenase-like lactoylglutathione lyase family enzyme
MSPGETSKAVHFEGVHPILRVQDLSASLDDYVRKLGFKIDWQGPFFASVSRGRCHIFLSLGHQGNPGSWVWIGVEDAEAPFNESRTKALPPTRTQSRDSRREAKRKHPLSVPLSGLTSIARGAESYWAAGNV